jgi:hypothetical protein
MTEPITIRHVVSIAGVVQDKLTLERIGGALVEITEGPPAFQVMLAAQAADPVWRKRRERLDRAGSQSDGIFTLVDLPAGKYRLRIGAPEMGSRYGVVEAGPIDVQVTPDAGPVSVAQLVVDLPPTAIHGRITRKVSGKATPVAGARVRLRGDTTIVRSGEDGQYRLLGLVQGKPTVEVLVAGLPAQTRTVEIKPGQDRQVDFAFA